MLTNLRIVSTIEDVLEGGWNLEDLNTAWNEFLKRLIGFLPQLLVAAVILAALEKKRETAGKVTEDLGGVGYRL